MDKHIGTLAEVELACSVPTVCRISGGYHVRDQDQWTRHDGDLMVGGGLSDNVELTAWDCEVVVEADVVMFEGTRVRVRIRPSEVTSVDYLFGDSE